MSFFVLLIFFNWVVIIVVYKNIFYIYMKNANINMFDKYTDCSHSLMACVVSDLSQ